MSLDKHSKKNKPKSSPEGNGEDGGYSDMDESQLQAEIEKVTAQLQTKDKSQKQKEIPQPKKREVKAEQKFESKQIKPVQKKFDERERDEEAREDIRATRPKQKKRAVRRGDSEEGTEADVISASQLLNKMDKAQEEDRKANAVGKPALQKLLMLDEVTRELRRLPVQSSFLGQRGCQILEYWLRQLPDGTFPNVSLVSELLQLIDSMQIDQRHLEGNELGKLVRFYAEGLVNMNAVRGLAKQIHDRWCRMLYEINTRYDAEGQYDRQYRNLKNKVTGRRQYNSDSDQDESDEDQQQSNVQEMKKKQEDEIKRGRVGIIMPHRNAFDFVERPEAKMNSMGQDKNKNEGRQKLRKVMDGLKRQNRQCFSNKRMSIVKSDH